MLQSQMVRMLNVVCVAEQEDGEQVRVQCDYVEVYLATIAGNLPHYRRSTRPARLILDSRTEFPGNHPVNATRTFHIVPAEPSNWGKACFPAVVNLISIFFYSS